jgi:Zn-dependent peptidase ImmA (M78 family)/DNA-binding XRE family transcriptional regulator
MAERDNILQFPNAAQPPAGRRLIPGRLRAARKLARKTQTELAEAINVSRQAVSAYEQGDKVPEPETFAKLARELDQPINFFTNESRETFGEFGATFFRKFGPDTLRRNEASEELSELFVQSARYLDQFVNYPAVDLPQFEPSDPKAGYSFEEIQTAANECRRSWKLGVGPISNVLALLESKGVAICRYEMEGENVEAFSFWNGPRPFIFMASEKEAGVRTRFDLAHEAGHLCLHKWMDRTELEDKETLRRVEKEADRFAAALLLPDSSFPNEVYSSRLDAFLPLKLRWRVSIQAMIYRCSDLGIIDPDQVLNLRKSISFRKWRTKEPYDNPEQIPLEQPRLLRQAVEMVIAHGRKHPTEVLYDLPMRTSLIERFFGLEEGTLSNAASHQTGPTLKS